MRNKLHEDQPTVRSFDDYQLYIGNDRANHFAGSDMTVAIGRGGSDHLQGGAMDDDLIGGKGNDHLVGGAGAQAEDKNTLQEANSSDREFGPWFRLDVSDPG